MRPRRSFVRPALATAAVLWSGIGVKLGTDAVLPKPGHVARGLRVDGVVASDASDASPDEIAHLAAQRVLARAVAVRREGGELVSATLGDLGARIDVDALARRLGEVGRRGDLWTRLDDALQAKRGRVDVRVAFELPVDALATRLQPIKDDTDTLPSAARVDFEHGGITPHTPGRYLDVYATTEAIQLALGRGDESATVEASVFSIEPRASSDAVATIDRSRVVSAFETRFGYLGDQRGRAQNVARAANGMDGVVLMPSETVSFNANVGARTIDNGFAEAPEIYKGEIRPGIGGGTCQVAGTLHAAAYLGGIDVVERSTHSRPSGYIRMGLDATVVYPTVDLKLRNPYDFPLVVHATIDRGTLRFELLGARRPATVTFDAATIGTADYKRKIEELASLPEGKMVLKQRGILGYSVKKTRTIQLVDGTSRVEVTTDTYPPTFEIYQVGPGADVASLPPVPDRRTAAAETSRER